MSKNKSITINNRKANFNYELIEFIDAGISLVGSEVKSIKEGNASISESYCYIKNSEIWITGMYVAEYKQSGVYGHEPYRKRKLLLTKRQINKFNKSLKTKGTTIVSVKVFVKNGLIKIKIALAKGKKVRDKRIDIKSKDMKRDVDRILKDLNK